MKPLGHGLQAEASKLHDVTFLRGGPGLSGILEAIKFTVFFPESRFEKKGGQASRRMEVLYVDAVRINEGNWLNRTSILH